MFIVFLHIHYALVATCTCVWALLMDYHRVLCVDIHTVLDRTNMYMCTSVQDTICHFSTQIFVWEVDIPGLEWN